MRPDILTASGQYFSFADPWSSKFGIDEIAHALSHICRFTGHSTVFYSVAQHSVEVSARVPSEHALEGLLHDAAEAFIGDVAAPLKQLLPDYKALEQQVEAAVFQRFGLPITLHPSVKRADLIMLATEQRDLMPRTPGDPWDWESIPGIRPSEVRLRPVGPERAREMFLQRFHQLTAGR